MATLRSWNQSYGPRPSHHDRGEHRYDTPSDVAALGRMIDLVRAGVSPAAAAKAARSAAHPTPALGDTSPTLAPPTGSTPPNCRRSSARTSRTSPW
ncbi:MerR family transcriptional regulator [Nocardia sp. NPDC001965]